MLVEDVLTTLGLPRFTTEKACTVYTFQCTPFQQVQHWNVDMKLHLPHPSAGMYTYGMHTPNVRVGLSSSAKHITCTLAHSEIAGPTRHWLSLNNGITGYDGQ